MRETRKQTQRRTRDRLLDATHEAIAVGGVSSVTIRGICEAAGYSQGAFYSNFASKDDLMLALMERHLIAEIAQLKTLIDSTDPEDLDQTLDALTERLALLADQTEWSLLTIELQLYARRDSRFAERYNRVMSDYHHDFAALLERLIARHDLRPALPPLQLSIGLYALWSGLVMQSGTDGAMPREAMMRAFFRAGAGVDPAIAPA